MTNQSPLFLLDSFAMLAFFQNEPGAERVSELLRQGTDTQIRLATTVVNLGEVVYRTVRVHGTRMAQEVIARVDEYPIAIAEIDRGLALAAALVKGSYAMSYADCFLVALAQQRGGIVVTGDPEFRQVDGLIPIEWLKQRSRG